MATFEVDVAGTTYEVDAPDEATAWKWAVATHRAPRIQEPTQPEQPSLASQFGRHALRTLAGPIEAGMTLGTGAIATPLAGLAGITGSVLPGREGQGADWTRKVSEALTYTPRTEQGQQITGAIGYPFEKLAEGADWMGGLATDRARALGLPESIAAGIGTGVNTAIQGAPLALGSKYLPAPNIPNPLNTAPVQAALRPIKGLMGTGRQNAQMVLRDIAGDKRAAVADALLRHQDVIPGSVATAGQAALPAGSAEFTALQEIIARRDPSKYKTAGIEGEQEAARMAMLGEITNPAEWRNPVVAPREAAERVREAVTRPLREQSVINANLGGIKGPELAGRVASRAETFENALQDMGRYQTMAAQQEGLAHGQGINLRGDRPSMPGQTPNEPYFNVGVGGGRALSPSAYPVEGLPRISERSTENFPRAVEAGEATAELSALTKQRRAELDFARRTLESFEREYSALNGTTVISQIDRIRNAPGNKTNSTIQDALGKISDLIREASDKRGVIDMRELYTIRKREAGNVIKKFADENKSWDQRFTAKLLQSVQGIIDDAIVKAGAPMWPEYLKQYTKYSRELNRMEVGEALQTALRDALQEKERPGVFGNKLRAIKEQESYATGKPRYADLTPGEQQIVTAVEKELAREERYSKLVGEGRESAIERLHAAQPKFPAVGPWSVQYTILKTLVNKLEGRATESTLRYLTKHMEDPQFIGNLMRDMPTPARRTVTNELMKYALYPSAAEGLGNERRRRIAEALIP